MTTSTTTFVSSACDERAGLAFLGGGSLLVSRGVAPVCSAPTLLVHGDASIFSVEGAEAIAQRIPASRLVVLDDVGHVAYIEAPRAFEAAVKAFVW